MVDPATEDKKKPGFFARVIDWDRDLASPPPRALESRLASANKTRSERKVSLRGHSAIRSASDRDSILEAVVADDEIVVAGRLEFDQCWRIPTIDRSEIANEWLMQMHFKMESAVSRYVSPNLRDRILCGVAKRRGFHPVFEFLKGLRWDGQPRLDRVGEEILGADGKRNTTIIRKWFLQTAAMADPNRENRRASILALAAPISIPTNFFFEVVAAPAAPPGLEDKRRRWYYGYPVISLQDLPYQLRGTWIFEWPDLAWKAQYKGYREAATVTTDRVWDGDSTKRKLVPRSAAIVTTTSREGFSGPEWMWTVHVRKQVDESKLAAWREQLWAEAYSAYRNGEPWWLSSEDAAQVKVDQSRHASKRIHAGDTRRMDPDRPVSTGFPRGVLDEDPF